MNWLHTEPTKWETDDYLIERDKNHRYLLSHKTEGPIRKYRLLEGAQRAAERHASGERKPTHSPKKRLSQALIKATLEFMEDASKL